MAEEVNPVRPDIAIVIRPSLKRACCEGDACRAAVFNQLLYCIAWKHKKGRDYWYGTYEEICTTLLDDSWGVSKVIKEVKALVAQGFLEQRRNPAKGWDQTRQYLFGEEQAKKFREACEKAEISCIEHQIGLPPDVVHLLKITNAITENNKCNCQIQQIDSANLTNASVKSNDAIPKTSSKTSNPKTYDKDRKNGESDADEVSSSHSSTQTSSLSKIVFSEEENAVYTLAEKLHLISLKRDDKHKVNCAILVEKGVTTLEQLGSLMQFCRQEPYLTGKALNLKNLINGLEGWLQLQRQMPTPEPEQTVTESDIASMVSAWSHIYKDSDRIVEHQQEVARIHHEYGMDNSTFLDLLHDVKEDTEYSGDKSMRSFFRMLEIRLRGKRKKAAQVC
jgi:hypothetical protein